ncbi:MAG: hypothetical protein Q4F21_11075 [Lachnospiraceae bacterium]|nr:hypothetical protein [Lachnospiraceae bacterium]
MIAAYIAANTQLCEKLILEDPPFFASQGERRKNTFNYVDLSTICHNYITQKLDTDFVLYYFSNQCAWSFFPEKSREKVRGKLIKMAASYRKKHPEKDTMFDCIYEGKNKYKSEWHPDGGTQRRGCETGLRAYSEL